MKWIRMFSAAFALAGMMASTNAGLYGSGGCKSCGCAEECQPACCKPTIARPCHTNVYTYQRKCSNIKPPCCDSCCAPQSCCAPAGCGNGKCGKNGCVWQMAAATLTLLPAVLQRPVVTDVETQTQAAVLQRHVVLVVGNGCVQTQAAVLQRHVVLVAAMAAVQTQAAVLQLHAVLAAAMAVVQTQAAVLQQHVTGCCAAAMAAVQTQAAVLQRSCCAHDGCGDKDSCGEACDCCNDDCCDIAKLIYTSMTACYARQRKAALDTLGRRYDCCCHPEIMNAFVYGLNDTDERVRREAADEIGDQVRRNRCCCSPCVVSALTCSLADCDRWVRREATQALRACGYEVVDGCCGGCCETGCGSTGLRKQWLRKHWLQTATPVSAPASAQPQPTPPAPEAVPAPAPPADPQAFFPSRLHSNQSKKSSLAGLFGMAR